MPGGSESFETRLHNLTATSAAAKAVKRAHNAAALAVQSALPPRPRSQYFSRNRSRPGSSTPPVAGRGDPGPSRVEVDDDGEGDEAESGRDGKTARRDEQREQRGQGSAVGPGAGVGGRAARASGDSTSSVSRSVTSSISRSITSSGVSDDYTTGDESSEDGSDEEDEDDEDSEDDEEEEEEQKAEEPRGKLAAAAGAPAPTPVERQMAPSRLKVVAAAMEAISAARSRLRQPAAGPGISPGGGHHTGYGPAASPSGSVAAADSPRLPPVVPRTRGGSHDAGAAPDAAGTHLPDSRRAEAATGGLSALRSPPMGAQASRRATLLAASPGAGGFTGVATAAAAAAGGSHGAAAGGGGERGECLAEWVAQRFRSNSRAVMPGMGAEAGSLAPQGRSVPGAAGGGGEACGGLRALLAARSDGAASWYARPARWYDPISPMGASHTSMLEARPSAHHPPALQVSPAAPVCLAPLDGRAQPHPPASQASGHRRGSNDLTG